MKDEDLRLILRALTCIIHSLNVECHGQCGYEPYSDLESALLTRFTELSKQLGISATRPGLEGNL